MGGGDGYDGVKKCFWERSCCGQWVERRCRV
jgi:hypothetical protein